MFNVQSFNERLAKYVSYFWVFVLIKAEENLPGQGVSVHFFAEFSFSIDWFMSKNTDRFSWSEQWLLRPWN